MTNEHHEISRLIPWYITGRLKAAERAAVAAHLEICETCATDVRSERQLAEQVADLEIQTDEGWTRLRSQLKLDDAPVSVALKAKKARRPQLRSASTSRRSPGWAGWAIAAQFAVIFVGALFLLRPATVPVRTFHVLGAAPTDRSANLMVIFHPDASERSIRSDLRASDARLVDGPTESNAYVLHVPAQEREMALVKLRKAAEIELAEPIDAGPE